MSAKVPSPDDLARDDDRARWSDAPQRGAQDALHLITDPEQVEEWQARYGGRDTYHDGLWITFDGDVVIVQYDDG